MRHFFIGVIWLYKILLSPLLGVDKCRFHPTCSEYGLEALQLHGSIKGLGLTIWRILRCQPFCRGGFDPVPPRKTNS